MFCETCQIEINETHCWTSHFKGVAHLKHERLMALLNENCLTHTEIAKRIGVSGERIRQLANRLIRQTGRERKMICGIDKAFARIADIPFVKAAKNRGFTVEPLSANTHCRIIVNGKYTLLRVTSVLKSGYHSITCPHTEADICVWDFRDGDFLIVPFEFWPSTQTALKKERKDENKKYGSHSTRHDWPSYINAWRYFQAEDQGISAPGNDSSAAGNTLERSAGVASEHY